MRGKIYNFFGTKTTWYEPYVTFEILLLSVGTSVSTEHMFYCARYLRSVHTISGQQEANQTIEL